MLPAGILAVVLIGGAVAVGVLNKKKPAEAEEKVEAPKSPFADMAPEAPPEVRNYGGDRKPLAPDGLLEDELWVKAMAIAREGDEHFEKAKQAKRDDDLATARDAGRLAREKYDEALESTAIWEEDLLAQYRETGPQVALIKKMRTRWFNNLAWIKKSVAH